MSKFTTKLKLKKIDINGKRYYKLKEPLIFNHKSIDYIVPKGFITDLTTIPYPLSRIIKKDNPKYAKGAVLHDWLYHIKINRFKADNLYFISMYNDNTPLRYAVPFYTAVRLFGFRYY